MGKYLAFLLIVCGLTFIGLGSSNLIRTNNAQTESLREAYKVIEEPLKEVRNSQTQSFLPKQGETIGLLDIPKINGKLPIIEGTDEDELDKGVGHLKESAYPTQNNQIVLSGHRDTVFKRMGDLKIEDTLTIHLPYGSFTYKIAHTRVVDSNDRTIIKSTFPQEVLIISTCYPFSFVGDAPERYIITAYPIETTESYY